jgi:uncharacterized protein YdcH (DUF465 family)
MLSFEEFYNESTSSFRRLYHYTQLSTVVSIVTSNRFELTFSSGADELSSKYSFYLSCTRIPTGQYAYPYYKNSVHCLIELDASKVSNNYKIVPIDYWGGMKDESEDRILSNKSSIDNAKSYIHAIHIYIPDDKEDRDNRIKRGYKVDDLDEAKIRIKDEINKIVHSGVEYYLYDNINDFSRLNTKKAHKVGEEYQYELIPRYKSDWTRHDNEFLNVIDWLENPTPENHRRKYDAYDFELDTDIHNNKRRMTPSTQNALSKLAKLMRVRKKTVKELIKDAQMKSEDY